MWLLRYCLLNLVTAWVGLAKLDTFSLGSLHFLGGGWGGALNFPDPPYPRLDSLSEGRKTTEEYGSTTRLTFTDGCVCDVTPLSQALTLDR